MKERKANIIELKKSIKAARKVKQNCWRF